MKKYGMPYKGSKSTIAFDIVDMLPPAQTFVDLFAGGCAVAHAAIESGKYKNVIINDVLPGQTQLFIDAINGKYKDENRWISREDFFKLKDTDAYVRSCWSFGNDLRTYMYGKDVEQTKRAYHYAIAFDDWQPLKAIMPEAVDGLKNALQSCHDVKSRQLKFCSILREHSENIERTQRIVNLQKLQNIDATQRMKEINVKMKSKISALCMDYRKVPIPDGAIIYCDIPYAGTNGYDGTSKVDTFDNYAFYDWAIKHKNIFISEYQLPSDLFRCIWQKSKLQSIQAYTAKVITERLYIPKDNTFDAYGQLMFEV